MALCARTNGIPGASIQDYVELINDAVRVGGVLVAATPVNAVTANPTNEVRAQWLATLSFSVFATKTARAVSLLVPVGLGQQSLVLARSIWEAAVTLEYMFTEPNLALRHAYFDPVQRMRLIKDKASKYPGSGWAQDATDAKRDTSTIQTQYDEAVKRFADLDKDAKGKATRDWAGSATRRDMAAKVGLEEDYVLMYDYLSQRAHAQAAGLSDVFESSSDGTVKLSTEDIQNVVLSVGNTVEYLLGILRRHNDTWGLNLASDFVRINQELDRLCPRYP